MKISDLEGKKMAVHCKTKELSDKFLNKLELSGFDTLLSDRWNIYGKNTCYSIYKGKVYYGRYSYYESEDYEIHEFEGWEEELRIKTIEQLQKLGKKDVIRCKTLDLATEFLAKLHSKGYRWASHDSLVGESNWDKYGSQTCYFVEGKQLCYSDDLYFERNGFKIYEFEGWEDELNIKKGMIIHCETEQQAIRLLEDLDRRGYKWLSGSSLTLHASWGIHKEETCYSIGSGMVQYASLGFYKRSGSEVTKFSDLLIPHCIEERKLYSSVLSNFNGHRVVEFYEDSEGQPNIVFSSGCVYEGYKRLKDFEANVEIKYGSNKNSLVYRTYMLEADKMRLALNLPALGTYVAIFRELLGKFIPSELAESGLAETARNHVCLWVRVALDHSSSFSYDSDNVIMSYEVADQNLSFNIGVDQLCVALGVTKEEIYNSIKYTSS
ncbi:hypothetical protein SAMN05446037_1006153 [Anaerovirgula multivorans]|uniref:Uncharacterized protein n=1 Tax=Anaerovirgula multivorans TaxID=312168 RepID=A0A239CVR0_9FIRM|nr:hypothetical protein [Anaerovirgula multivorans]SNS23624.1 hypothetical protein SAMN05446037_1006153 [Anaerovirgula multivorans]